MSPVAPAPSLLGDRYRLDRLIAVGGMGEVWRGEDEVLGRPVAVKVLKQEYAGDPIFLLRFRNEARHTALLHHPGIAALYDYGEISCGNGASSAYLVMELVEGEPLSALIRRDGALELRRALTIIGHTALALQAAHEAGLVHRDVKPANLLVRTDGVVKVTDFGIAWAGTSVPLTDTGAIMGTAHYLSPEQVAGEPATAASDVYSLGVVAYECLAGARPFPGTTPLAIAMAHLREQPPPLPSWVPAEVAALVESALAKSPGDRPRTAGELGATALRLAGALAAVPTPAPSAAVDLDAPETAAVPAPTRRHERDSLLPPPLPVQRQPATSRSRRSMVGVGAVALVAVATLLLLPSYAGNDEQAATAGTRATPSAAATPAAAARATVDPRRYVGRPLAAVRDDLVRRGLQVTVAGGATAGTVTALTPTGAVPLRTVVTLTVAAPATPARVAPAQPVEQAPTGKGSSKGKGKGKR